MNLDNELAAATADREESYHRARIHEAGHTVVAHLAGDAVASVIILDGEGETWHRADPDRETRVDDEGFAERIKTFVRVFRAGEAAEIAFGLADPGSGSGKDRSKALEAAGHLAEFGMVPQEIFEAAFREAVDLCQQHRHEISVFADELEANGDRLDGSEVEAALANAFFDRLVEERQTFEALFAQHPDDDLDELWQAARQGVGQVLEAADADDAPVSGRAPVSGKVAPVSVFVAGKRVAWDPATEPNPARVAQAGALKALRASGISLEEAVAAYRAAHVSTGPEMRSELDPVETYLAGRIAGRTGRRYGSVSRTPPPGLRA